MVKSVFRLEAVAHAHYKSPNQWEMHANRRVSALL